MSYAVVRILGSSSPVGLVKWLSSMPRSAALRFMSSMKCCRLVSEPASVSAASLPELRKTPYMRSRSVTTSPALRPITVESASTPAASAGTWTCLSSGARSAATIAVRILARLAGARAALGSRPQSSALLSTSTTTPLAA